MAQTSEDVVWTARQARRNPASEATMVWSFSGLGSGMVYMVALFNFQWVPIPFGLSLFGAVIVFGAMVGGIVAAIYFSRARVQVAQAKQLHAEHLHAAESARRTDAERRIETMTEKTAR